VLTCDRRQRPHNGAVPGAVLISGSNDIFQYLNHRHIVSYQAPTHCSIPLPAEIGCPGSCLRGGCISVLKHAGGADVAILLGISFKNQQQFIAPSNPAAIRKFGKVVRLISLFCAPAC
jgi:hypothetical protein